MDDDAPIPTSPAGVNGMAESEPEPFMDAAEEVADNNAANNSEIDPVPARIQPEASTSTRILNKTIIFTSTVFRDPDDFEAFRMSRVDCDLELRFYTQQAVFAHKIVLRRRSAYFSRRLAAEPDCTYLEMAFPINSTYIELLIKYIYTGHLEVIISPKSLTHLIMAAKDLELHEINLSSMGNLLKEKISPQTCWLIKEVARELQITELINHLNTWMERNFAPIVAEDGFLNVQFDDVIALIQNASREITSEIEIFEGLVKWVEHDEEARKDGLYDLIKTINLEAIFNLDPDLLQEKFQEGSVLERDTNCCKAFDLICRKKAFEYSARLKNEGEHSFDSPMTPSSSPTVSPPVKTPMVVRLPKSVVINITPLDTSHTGLKRAKKNDKLLRKRPNGSPHDLTEGSTRNASDSDCSTSSDIQLLTKKPKNVAKRSSVSFQKHLAENYRIRDSEMRILNPRNHGTTMYFDVYNFHTNTTKHLYQVRKPRDASSIVVVEDALYHIGGAKPNSEESIRDVDIYNPVYKRGFKGQPLVAATKNAATCTFNNAIYVIGGEELEKGDNCTHNLTQMLDLSTSKPSQQKWVLKQYMHHTRDCCGVAVLGNKIFAAGGYGTSFKYHDQTYPLKTVECYSAELDKWELMKKSYLKEARAHVRLCTLDNKLYAVGGYDYETVVPVSYEEEVERPKIFRNTVEVFDPNRGNDWAYIANMNDQRYAGVVFAKNGLLYAIGGNVGPEPTAEFYDPRINMWQYLTWPSELAKPKDELDYSLAIPLL